VPIGGKQVKLPRLLAAAPPLWLVSRSAWEEMLSLMLQKNQPLWIFHLHLYSVMHVVECYNLERMAPLCDCVLSAVETLAGAARHENGLANFKGESNNSLVVENSNNMKTMNIERRNETL
jgi:hypothetical protein